MLSRNTNAARHVTANNKHFDESFTKALLGRKYKGQNTWDKEVSADFSAKFLRFPANFCENLSLHAANPRKSRNQQKSGKKGEFGSLCPFELSL